MSNRLSRRSFLKMGITASAGAALAACAQAAPQSNQQAAQQEEPAKQAPAKPAGKLVFSSYTWSGYEESMNQVITDWKQKNPDATVETMYAGWDDYWQKLTTLVAAGTPPDVGMADYGRLVSYAKSGTLLALDNFIQSGTLDLDQLVDAGVAQYRWRDGDFDSGGEGGKLYGVPSDAQSMIFVYNKKLFDAAGVAYPTDDWTWNDLVEAGKKISNPDADQWGVANTAILLDRGASFYQTNSSPYSADFKKATLLEDGVKEAYKWAWDLIYTHKIAPPVGRDFGVDPFLSGKVGMEFHGIWMLADYAQIKDFEWDMAMLPKNPGTGKQTTTLEADGWWVFKKASNPDLAWDLVQYMVKPEGQKMFSSLNFIVPPSNSEIAQTWYAQTPPANRKKSLENLEKDSGKFMGTYFDRAAVTGAYYPVLDKAFNDGDDILTVLEEANTVMQEELDKAWERFTNS